MDCNPDITMSLAGKKIWIWANTLTYPEGGGHLWVYLNWALGLKSLGCEVTWLEVADPSKSPARVARFANILRERLNPFGLDERIALRSLREQPLAPEVIDGFLTLDCAGDADLLLNFYYLAEERTLKRFKRTALVDIDPGLLQIWISEGQITLAPHDRYFTIGEFAGRREPWFNFGGIQWQHTPPCVALDAWAVTLAPAEAPFTTVSTWASEHEYVQHGDDLYCNDKRTGFAPFLDLPRMTKQPLMLAICQSADANLTLDDDELEEKRSLEQRGWRIEHAHAVASTPADYRRFIQRSKGEFSCAKPSCIRLQTAWLSDRTLCYLASGKPAIVQHTGPSRFLPDDSGIFRFRDVDEAARYLDRVGDDYANQCARARSLAEECFDARKVASRVLQRALD